MKAAVSVCILKYASWVADDSDVIAQHSVLCVFCCCFYCIMIVGGCRTLSCKVWCCRTRNLLHDLWWVHDVLQRYGQVGACNMLDELCLAASDGGASAGRAVLAASKLEFLD